jgi:hypothetical protein
MQTEPQTRIRIRIRIRNFIGMRQSILGTATSSAIDPDTAAMLLWYSQPYSDFRVLAARLSVILYVIVCILV